MKKNLLTLFCLAFLVNLKSQTTITLGSGNDTSGTSESSPINIYYRSHHCQILYTVAELNAAGWAGQGSVSKLGFNIYGTTSEGLPNFNIKLKNVSATNVDVYNGTGLITVYSNSLYNPAASGFELLNLSSNFMWDGISNLLVDVCFDQVGTYTPTGRVYRYPYTNSGSEYKFTRDDGSAQCGIPTNQIVYGFKPQLQLELTTPTPCSGMPMTDVAMSTASLVCPNTEFNLSLSNQVINSGLVFQWQSSVDNSVWSNMGAAQPTSEYSIASILDTMYYRCLTTCTISAQTHTSIAVQVNHNPLINCYCMPNITVNPLNCNGDKIQDFSLANVVFQTSACDVNGYSDSTASNSTIINLSAGLTYSLQANILNSGIAGNMAAGAWIDYNSNAIFEPSEFIYLGNGTGQIYSNTLNVPVTAPTGIVRMRLKVDANYANVSTVLDACNNNNGSTYGQILDYKVNITAAVACSGAPNAGDAISTKTTVCQNENYQLDLINNSIASNITYQWQSSLNGTLWANLGVVQNTIPYSVATQSASTYYRCITTCTTSSPLSSTSTPVMVSQNLPTACYCVTEPMNCSNANFSAVNFASLSDNPICNVLPPNAGYIFNTTNTVTINANQTYTISNTINTQGTSYIGAWIDYNHNGIFELNEYAALGSGFAGTYTSSISVPFTAIGGLTRMRLKLEDLSVAPPNLDPCVGIQGTGQTLDYPIFINAATPCTGTPNAGNAITTITTTCENRPFTLNLNNNGIVSNISYQWQSSPDNVNWSNMGSAQSNVPFTVASQSVTTHYRCLTTCTTSVLTSTSTPIAVYQTVANMCYCIPPISVCASANEINYVVFATLNNTSACSTNGYSDYAPSVASCSVQAGNTYTMDVTVGSDYNGHVAVWIDSDQNGVFDTYEYTNLGITNSIGVYTVTNVINIPTGAVVGNTKMRVRNNYSFMFGNNEACANGANLGKATSLNPGDGETEDYLLTILAPDCSSINFPPSVSLSGNLNVCVGSSTTLDLSTALPEATGITYQWKYYNGTTYVNEGAANSTSSLSASPIVNTPYFCEILCNANHVINTDTVFIIVRQISTSPLTTSVSCYGGNNGAISLNAFGSGSTLSYTWTPNVGSTDNVTNLVAGTYTTNIIDGYNCTLTETITVIEPSAISSILTSTDVTCMGLLNGSASASSSGGTPGYVYTWLPGGNIATTITNLGAGVYTCQTMDLNNCLSTNTISVIEPLILGANPTFTNASCFGMSDGSISISVFGGTPSYSFSWLPTGGILNNEVNLSAGIYTVTVTDVNSCVVTQTIQLVDPPLLASSETHTNVTCFGLSNGNASVTVNGGTSPYTFSWTPNTNTTSLATGLSANSYSCFITDANLCSTTQTISISEPIAIASTVTHTDVSCFGFSDGAASVALVGGVSPLSFSWSPSGGTGLTASNLAAGNYSFSVIDGNGCSLTEPFTVLQFAAMSVSISGLNPTCDQLEDTLKSSITGGASPFTYAWNELPGTIVGSNPDYTYVTTAGTYSYNLSVTDANNCTVVSNTLSTNINLSSNFSGTVTTSPSLPVAGRVVLYQYLPFYTKFDSVQGQDIGTAGEFLFSGFKAGIYIIKAIPTATNLQVAYGDSAVNWKTAKHILHGCTVNDVQNIKVLALNTFSTPGTGSMSGQITEGLGYGQRPFGSTDNGNGSIYKPTAPGQPIGGIIVKGGRNPGGQMFVQTTTAADGTYTLSGLPDNAINEEYFIVVDIPGLDTNSTYHQVITPINHQLTNLNFVVDSTKINPTTTGVSVNDMTAIENQIKVFPNPTTNKVTVQYNLPTNSTVKIELYDILGKSVKTILPTTDQTMSEHSYTVPLNDITSGMYFMKLKINNSESVVKLFVIN